MVWYIDNLTLTTLNLTLHNVFCLASTKAGTNLMNIQTKMPLTFDDNNFCWGCDEQEAEMSFMRAHCCIIIGWIRGYCSREAGEAGKMKIQQIC